MVQQNCALLHLRGDNSIACDAKPSSVKPCSCLGLFLPRYGFKSEDEHSQK